jgi:4-hydroxy-4-methyl-2-oxoglutarate aldolase
VKPVVVQCFSRPDAQRVRTLPEAGVTTVHEAQRRTGLMRPYLRPIYSTARVAGTAVTVLCEPGDNPMIRAAVETCRDRLPMGELGVDVRLQYHRERTKLWERS